MPRFLPHAWTWRSSKWVHDSSGAFDKPDVVPDVRENMHAHSRLKHARQSRVNQPDDAFGDRKMTKGEHKFVFDIDSCSSSGSGVRVGVASEDGRERWGIRPVDGRAVYVTSSLPSPDLEERTQERERLSSAFLADKPMAASRQERAVGRRIEVCVDMTRRLVTYSVDGGTGFDSGVLPDDYPDVLVPWAQLFYKEDSVTLSQHRSRAVNRKASPRSPATPRKPSSPATPTCDSGPWTP